MQKRLIFTVVFMITLSILCIGCTTAQNAESTPAVYSTVPLKLYSNHPLYTEKDIEDVTALIEKYFDALHNKDTEKIVECCFPTVLTMEDIENGREVYGIEQITLVKIHDYDTEFQKPFMENILDEFEEKDILVFKVDYKVSIPEGKEKESILNEGMYYDWAMILVRDSYEMEWLIYSQGY